MNRLGTQQNDAMIKLDSERRAKVEKKAGKLTDAQWLQYKSMKNVSRSKF